MREGHSSRASIAGPSRRLEKGRTSSAIRRRIVGPGGTCAYKLALDAHSRAGRPTKVRRNAAPFLAHLRNVPNR